MSRSESNKGKKPSGRQGGGYRKKSYARGNAPIKKAAAPGQGAGPRLVRLNKYIANAGVCSRREADTYIAAGNVTVNGKTITEMGYKVSPGDEVRFDGRLLQREKKEYVLLNKPKNFITTTRDEKGRRTVMELISSASSSRLLPVGRLDRNTTGLLLFTNDGDLAKTLTHPKHGVRKIYHVELNKNLKASDLDKIREGLELEDGPISVDEASYIAGAPKREVGIKIHSGRNRIVRRIFEHLGYQVVKLDRVVFAGLTKKDLPRGHWRHLTPQEVINLKMIT
jgi:23S rRNA pseudouridine2605 synthase